ncbi:MAG: periplasmic heavy metal sensor [Steroidobacteraceae bacterium]|jgi:protein CpxP
MNNPTPTGPSAPSGRRLFSRYTAVAFLAGAALAAGVGGLARSEAMSGWHRGIMDGTHSAAEVSAHVDHMLKHFYVEVDATDAQKAQIGPLVKQAVNDLIPLHSRLQSAHSRAMQALEQPTVDRASLEAVRAEHLQLADEASKRIAQLIGDVGDVLTPTQRKALTGHLERLHGMPHS